MQCSWGPLGLVGIDDGDVRFVMCLVLIAQGIIVFGIQ